MKPVFIDILLFLADKPGVSQNRIGVELSDRWNSSYIRAKTSELIHQGLISADKSGRGGYPLTLTETGLQALREAQTEAPGVTA